jgi:predicted transcriptional regulator
MQKITTPGGETMIVLPLDDYKALVDASDAAAARAVRADIEAGLDEMLPADMVKRILAGESPIRVWREHRGLNARELAAKSGLSAPYISEMEGGKKDGSVSAVKKIAEALGVEIGDIV